MVLPHLDHPEVVAVPLQEWVVPEVLVLVLLPLLLLPPLVFCSCGEQPTQ